MGCAVILKLLATQASGIVLHLEGGWISSPDCFKGLLCLSSMGFA